MQASKEKNVNEQINFNCDLCSFRGSNHADLKDHKLKSHSKSDYKCQKCDFTANSKVNLTSHIQAEHEGGVIRTPAGFMVLGESLNNDESEITDETAGTKKRKSRAEYLKSTVKVKTLPHKGMVGSFKDKFLTVKKTAAEIQEEHGCSADVIVMVRNNLQDPGNKNAAPSAGKYLVYASGPARKSFMEGTLGFSKKDCFMLADSSTMKEEKIEEQKNVSESSETSEDEKDNHKVSEGNSDNEEYNSKKTKKKTKWMLAKKVFTPGAQTFDHSGDSSLSD